MIELTNFKAVDLQLVTFSLECSAHMIAIRLETDNFSTDTKWESVNTLRYTQSSYFTTSNLSP